MINCIGCIHYNIMYQEKPKMVFDGCVLYDTYLKRDKDDRVVPCTMCNNTGNINFLDIRNAYGILKDEYENPDTVLCINTTNDFSLGEVKVSDILKENISEGRNKND